jgi:hypothetical protein
LRVGATRPRRECGQEPLFAVGWDVSSGTGLLIDIVGNGRDARAAA